MSISCFIIGGIILAVSVLCAVKNRHNMRKWITCLTLGVFFSTFFMVLPTEWIKAGKAVSSPVLYIIASALCYSFKALGGRADLIQIESIALDGWVRTLYITINYIAFIVAPIMASSLLLSFFGDTLQRARYWLQLSSKCCVFSVLDDNSLVLAKGLKKEHDKKTIVFCNTKNADAGLAERARKMGAILLYQPCYSLKIAWQYKKIEYYLISESEHENIKCAEMLIACEKKRGGRGNKLIVVNAFTKNPNGVELLESLIPNNERFQIRFINNIALFCDRLINKYPLYELPNDRKDISVMIVGCGDFGMQMLKTIIRNGQIDGYTLKLRVYDKNANHIERALYHCCPELKVLKTDLEFIESDVQTDTFFEKAKASLDATYVCVVTGSDELNLNISTDLFRFFRRENGFSYTPPIFTRVRKDEIAENLVGNDNSFLDARKIHLFGTAASFFSEGTLFNSKLEKIAFATHLCYQNALGKDKHSDEYINATREFFSSEYNRRSSMAAALHFSSKIFMCCDEIDRNSIFSEDNLLQYEHSIRNADVFDRLTENEHVRWNYFMSTEGFVSGTMDDVKKFFPETGKHKDETLSKTHSCIIPFDRLKDFTGEYNAWANAEKDFIKSDKEIVKQMPNIIRFAKKLYEEDK